ncbi:unnamed protein product [Protopolystoma xenopodis]|uniref:Uncharacterized protein n=1 Tax=Protopolystoma xenopodis TaxID=117903 RepID=A0A448X195_9PLAT|nr:unnamed protein product [Protopolystoma xenopodis]
MRSVDLRSIASGSGGLLGNLRDEETRSLTSRVGLTVQPTPRGLAATLPAASSRCPRPRQQNPPRQHVLSSQRQQQQQQQQHIQAGQMSSAVSMQPSSGHDAGEASELADEWQAIRGSSSMFAGSGEWLQRGHLLFVGMTTRVRPWQRVLGPSRSEAAAVATVIK